LPRGQLEDSDLDQIAKKLPEMMPIRLKALAMNPDFMCAAFGTGSDIPVGAVCLQDATDVLCDAWLALHEFYAHALWYRVRRQPNDDNVATAMEKFFLDGLAYRLYAAAEHLANAIVFILELSDVQLDPYRGNRVSQQSVVGHYLLAELPDHDVTAAVRALASNPDWKKSLDYRGRLVHEQPPTVDGLGIIYRRESRWKIDPDTLKPTVYLRMGDSPELTTGKVCRFLEEGLIALREATTRTIEYFETVLNERGMRIEVDETHGKVRFEFG